MTGCKSGDWVLIRAKVVDDLEREGEVYVGINNARGGVAGVWAANDVIVGPAEPPLIPEPDHDCIVIDRENDVWRWEADGFWHIANRSIRMSWGLISPEYGPFRVFREVK